MSICKKQLSMLSKVCVCECSVCVCVFLLINKGGVFVCLF